MGRENQNLESWVWLAAVVAAHPHGKVVGGSRLQNTVKLLQRIGMPCRYHFMNFFHGPYSEAVNADIGRLATLGLIEELEEANGTSKTYAFQASKEVRSQMLGEFKKYVEEMSRAASAVLDCAATFDAMKELGLDDGKAREYTNRKKGAQCDMNTTKQALALLERLGLREEDSRA